MFVDSHCHLYMIDLDKLGTTLDQVVADAHKAQVGQLLCVAVELDNMDTMVSLLQNHEQIYGSVGVHPSYTGLSDPEILIEHLNRDPKLVALGETGLDFYHSDDNRADQIRRFEQHIEAAALSQKPLIVHTRSARQETIEILKHAAREGVGGVIHCFTETYEMAKAALDLGFYISVSGILTFTNAQELRDTVKRLPMDRMLIETDSPYLAPVPHRGQINQPAHVVWVAKKLAELKHIAVDEVATMTTENFQALFSIPAIPSTAS